MKTTRGPAFVNTSAANLRAFASAQCASAVAEAIADELASQESTQREQRWKSNQPSVSAVYPPWRVASCSNQIAATPHKTKVQYRVWRNYSMLAVC